MDLILVESPTKAKHISGLLGAGYKVIPTLGHLMELPSNELAIEVTHGFLPQWVVAKGKAAIVTRIKDAARHADRIVIATDPDREGEGIAYHLYNLLPKALSKKAQRAEFREITYNGILQGLERTRGIDYDMAMAQQARRVLDRLTGYEISPFLWKHIKGQKGLSAGRVQSAALKLLYDREMEIKAFRSRVYWLFEGIFYEEDNEEELFRAQLTHFCDASLRESPVESEEEALAILNSLQQMEYEVEDMTNGKKGISPPAPFVTTTLLQESSTRLGMSPKAAMKLAQELFEGISIDGKIHGLITYMRTDSPRVSEEAQEAAKDWIKREYGAKYIPDKANEYKASEQAQDAHECIRPTMMDLTPAVLKAYLSSDQLRLYELIYVRFIQSQMAAAVYNEITALIRGSREKAHQETATLKATSTKLLFDGWKALGSRAQECIQEPLERLEEGTILFLHDIKSQQHHTQPPSRYNAAQLIHILEKKGIGRPSTYSTIVDTLQSRHYVEMGKNNMLLITALGISVIDVLKTTFPAILDCKYTASMENKLDQVASGQLEWVRVVEGLYQEIQLAKNGARMDLRTIDSPVVYRSPKIKDPQKNRQKPIHITQRGNQEPNVQRLKKGPPPMRKPALKEMVQESKTNDGFFKKLFNGLRDHFKK